ncbi:MAG: trehalose-phosphatase [Syntrophaceae bacterium]
MKPDRGGETLWFFDFDGTISEFAARSAEAEIHPACRDLLRDLASLPLQRVAILSSRSLDDLVTRVEIPGVFLGGGSGMEWRRPTGERFLADPDQAARLKAGRKSILPNLRILEQIPGVEMEDKQWSMAVHVLRAPRASRNLAGKVLSGLRDRRVLSFFMGRAVYEIPLLPGVNKAGGVKRFSEILHVNRDGCRIVYAGDDENDATAMAWVIRQGGTAFSVGKKTILPAARHVPDPEALAAEIRRLFKFNGNRIFI